MSAMMRVLVTGGTGFVGSALCDVLAQRGYLVRVATRKDVQSRTSVAEEVVVGDIAATTEWRMALSDVDTVIHAAARVHVLHDSPANADAYMETNARGTERLAAACARAGVRRFVYLSSIKVNGEATTDRPFTAFDPPAPVDNYGISKLSAEQALLGIAATSDMEVVIIRPPLVYGPGVRANFLRLMSWVHGGMPLPLGAVNNLRSMVSVWNLCDLIRHSIEVSAMTSGVFMVSDGMDLSTPELIRGLARAMKIRARLISVPLPMLRIGGSLVGKRGEISRLLGSLQVDISATCNILNWTPPLSVDAGLARTTRWYLDERKSRAP